MPEHRHGREGTPHEQIEPALRNKRQEGSTTEVQRKRRKTTKKEKTTRAEKVKPFRDFAKWIGRSENPFISFGSVLRVGLDLLPSEEDDDEDAAPMSLTDCNECMRIFKLIEKRPGWKNLLAKIDGGSEKWLNILVDEMDAGLGAGGAEDRNSLKYDGLRYARPNGFDPPIPFRDDKSAYRGFNHIQIAELLCPVYHLPEFAEDTHSFQQKLQNGEITVSGDDLPYFLYDENEGFMPSNLFFNLLRSPILVRTWRHIFTGPSTAMKETAGYAATKDCQAKLHGMTKATPRSIAYAAVHVRWFLSNYRDWRINDGVFLLSDFFWTVTNLFEDDPTSDWAVETLEWFNKQVFNDTATKKRTALSGQTGRERLALHRANGGTTISRAADERDVVASDSEQHNSRSRPVSPSDEREDQRVPSPIISNSDTESDSQYDNATKHAQARPRSTTPHLNRIGRDGVRGDVRQNTRSPQNAHPRPTTPRLNRTGRDENIRTPQKVNRSSSTLGSLSPITPSPKAKAKKPRQRNIVAAETTSRTLRSRNTQLAVT